jgi:hypothetical protein
MIQKNQDFTAGRIHPAQFDCELPDDIRAQLGKPKRPGILGRPRPVKPPPPRALLYLVLVICALTLVGTAINLWRQQERERASSTRAISQPLAPQPTPTPAATPESLPSGSAERWKEYLATQPQRAPEVRRAERVSVPRAEQVFRLGIWSPVWMPAGKLTWVRFLGVKDTFADLPRNPQIGDSYGVLEGGQRALWVWHILPGHSAPAWVDP